MTAKEHLDRGDRLAWIEQKQDDGLREYQRALEIDPSLAEAHVRIAGIRHVNNDLEGAIAEHRKALKIRPDWTSARHSMAHLLVQVGRLDEAINEYQRVISEAPKGYDGYLGVGECYLAKGQFDLAIDSFETAVKLGRSIPLRMWLADAYRANGDIEKAVEQWKRVAKWRPSNSDEIRIPGDALRLLAEYNL